MFCDPKTGKYYLYWGNGTIVCSELADDMTSIKSSKVILPRRDKQRYNYNEGTYVFYRNGRYYFTWSENDTRSKNYRVRCLVSDSPTEFVRDGQPATVDKTIVLQRDDQQQIYGTGHHAVISKPAPMSGTSSTTASPVRELPSSTGVPATTARYASTRSPSMATATYCLYTPLDNK